MTNTPPVTDSGRPIRLGIVGLGLIAQSVHLPNLAALRERFEIVHVCDLSAGLAASIAEDLGGVRHGTDAERLVTDSDVDAVLICTPGAHSALARTALEAGKHVFAEKPYAYDPAVAARDAAYAEEHGLVLQVGYMKMYEPAVSEARARLAELGTVRVVRMTVLHPSDERQTTGLALKRFDDVAPARLEEALAANRSEVAEALEPFPGVDPVLFRNVLHGSVCHQASVLRALFPDGSPTLVAVDEDAPGSERVEPPKLQVLGRVADGVQWSLSWNWLTDYPAYSEWVEIYGDRGSMTIRFPGPYDGPASAELTVAAVAADGGVDTATWRPAGPTAFERELREFWESIRTGAAVRSDARGAAADARLLLEIGRLAAR